MPFIIKCIIEKQNIATKLVTYINNIFFLISSNLNSFILSPIVGFSTSFPKYETFPPNCTPKAPATALSECPEFGLA